MNITRCISNHNTLLDMCIDFKDFLEIYCEILREDFMRSEEYIRMITLGLTGPVIFEVDKSAKKIGIDRIEAGRTDLSSFTIYFSNDVFKVKYIELYNYFRTIAARYENHHFIDLNNFEFETSYESDWMYYETYALLGFPYITNIHTQMKYLEKNTYMVMTEDKFLLRFYRLNQSTITSTKEILITLCNYATDINYLLERYVNLSNKLDVIYYIDSGTMPNSMLHHNYVTNKLTLLATLNTKILKDEMRVIMRFPESTWLDMTRINNLIKELEGKKIRVELVKHCSDNFMYLPTNY